MARRLNTLHYIFVGVMCGACVYLWTHNKQVRKQVSVEVNKESQAVIEETEKLINTLRKDAENEVDSGEPNPPNGDDPQPPIVDSNLENNVDNVNIEVNKEAEDAPPINPEEMETTSVKVTLTTPKAATETTTAKVRTLEPFDEVVLPKNADANRTLDWLDLWADDPNCTQFDVTLLEEKSVEPRALVSFPGSGNSWLRMLLMGLSGIFVHSVYSGDDSLFRSKAGSSYQVPPDCGCTLLQKTHDFSLDAMLFNMPLAHRSHSLTQFKGQGVLILRNPFKAIRAYRNFDFGGMAGMAPNQSFIGPSWDNFVARSLASWETLAITWITGLKRGGVIYYEKLQHETKDELARLAAILGIRSMNQDRLQCVLRHANDNTFKRQHNNTAIPEDPYTASQRLLIRKSIDNVNDVLLKRGFDALPVNYYSHYSVAPEYGLNS